MRDEERIGDQRRHHGASNNNEDKNGILLLINDIVSEPEERRDGAEGQARGHEERRVNSFFLGVLVRLGGGIDADDLRDHL